ncbi:MAG: single-stranded-DNA-specific exonuclease RecJ [Rickettsiaceae bacterium]|nr:single-stranded-DNA-specific exonuclease RecJ [Rickettsiaceae bacterium]
MPISVSGRTWSEKNINERLVYKYVKDFEISDTLARIIVSREIPESEVMSFLHPKIRDLLPDPFHLKDMEKACKRVAEAAQKKEKIIIFGDYDVDGATSSALLVRLLENLGVSCKAYIPDRIKEGYGPTIEAMQKFKKEGADLVITVDCGVSAFAPASFAKEIGLDLIILDHHLSEITLPDAYAIVNPNRFDEETEYKYLAAVGVCFLFSVGLVRILRNMDFFRQRQEPDLMTLLDLVALGTICDMMPVTGINRAFVVQGLKIMSNGNNLGIKLLAEFGKIDGKFSAYHLGFIIGPRINAGGRVGESFLGSFLLSTKDMDDAYQMASKLEQYNEERKLIEQAIIEEAVIMAESQHDKPYILVHSENWHQGVIGIVAGKLKERYQKPAIAISVESGIGKASCRSIKGINLGHKISEAKELGVISSGGGHAMAAGFVVDIEKIDALKAFFDDAIGVDSHLGEENNRKFYDAIVSPGGVTIELAKEIETLEPYGNGNEEPIILVEGLYVLKANIANNKHIMCLLAPDREAVGTKPIRAVCFNALGTQIADALLSQKPLKLSVLCNIKVNNWQGNQSPQISIYDLIVN